MSSTATTAAPDRDHAGPGPAVDATPAGGPGRRQDLVLAAGAALASALVFLLVRGSLIDDAYITLSYARNLAEHWHWGLTEFRTANTATSPLNVVVLAAGAFVTRDGVWGLGLVFVLLGAAQAWGLSRLARDLRLPAAAAAAAFALVLLSPLMLSIVGMEMTLGVTLLVWLTVAAVERRPVLFGLMTAALVLTRVDLGIFPLVFLLTSRPMLRRAPVAVAVAAVAALPWYLFSWFHLGALVPDTLVLKTITGSSWGPWEFLNGPLLYWRAYPAAMLITTLAAGVGGLALVLWVATRAWRRPVGAGLGPLAALGLGGVGHYAAYSLLSPPPYHWYYAPSAASLTIVGALGLGGALLRARAADTRPGVAPRVAVGLVAAALLVTDVAFVFGRGVPWEQVPITTNWATAAEYAAVGEQLRTQAAGEVIASPGEIGNLAYHCRCDIVDSFSDRGALLPAIEQGREDAGPLMRAFLDLNFAHLDTDIEAATPTRALTYRGGPDASGTWPVHSSWLGPGALELTTPAS
ncbi:hypothetical protein GB931_20955 [Modestobacter sp. I12A-02628]|uniref:Glycosyltransferase RgtA/B/C/D-like domain-containing protein n=1 Tax=Goekera deserti TaxID=2497753 RepID=A0A7K3W818_9ACTN|nr:hypothetical protein [Goekera deserti]MPR00344.1 hypothetical protein [Goekera deserti]NDI49518.1 hypothetical protein [Goekera deserti]NEL52608.1 hypothetical protein [Goekera deserti]